MERKVLIYLRSQGFRPRIIVLRYNPNRFYTWKKNALLQEIIACMTENGDYSQTELDEFWCSIFFESIEAGLLADKYVKIKGFGTFVDQRIRS